MKLILSIFFTLTILFSYAQTPQTPQTPPDGSIVAQHGRLQVSGSYVGNQHGQKISLAGNSLFWSVDDGSGGAFYTSETVNHLADEWNTSIIRAAMGVREHWPPSPVQGYIVDSLKEITKVNTVVNAAIDKGIYVIIDWHSHDAENYQQEAIAFFTKMAELYGTHPNVIYEIYNEPINTSWPVIKSYAEAVISAIRSKDPDNLIVVGTRTFSQNVLEASQNKINDVNVAYTLHFYAGERDHDRLRGEAGEAKQAMNNGIAIFVTEWGTVPANGGTGVYSTETLAWMDFLKQNYISHANWSVSDKPGYEDHPIIEDNAGFSGLVNGQLTESGILVKDIIKNWNVTPVDIDPQEEGTTKFEAESAQLIGVNVVDGGSASGGQYVSGFTDNGDKIVFNNINAPSAGTYSLTIRYASGSFKENFIQVNNGSLQSFPFPASNVFSSITYDVNLIQGNNTITIEKNWGWFDVDYIAIDGLDGEEPEQPEPEGTLTLEAESAQLIGVNSADNGSASGGRYVTGFTDSGDRIIFNNVNAPSTGTYPLTIRYACTSDKNNFVQINNGNKDDIFFPESIGFADKTFDINLNQGSNTITIEKKWGWFDVDYIKIGGLDGGENPDEPDPQPQGTITIEAESGVPTAVTIQSETSASNGEYVTGFTDSGDKIAVTANIISAGMYQVNIGYRSNSGAKTNDLYLNGSFLQNVVFPQSSSFNEITAGDFYFEAGQSTIEFVKNWGWMDVDYFKLSPAENTDGNSSNNICDRTIQINANATAVEYVGKIINSTATILSDNSTEFKAVEEINLNKEFTVEKGGNFSSSIEDCTD